MSNRDRRKPPSRRRRETAESAAFRAHLAEPAVDLAALDRICSPGGIARIDGEEVAIVLPHRDPEDPSEFDALVCAAGLGRFVRPRVASDGLDHLLPASTAHMLVRELAAGIRARTPIEIYPDGALN